MLELAARVRDIVTELDLGMPFDAEVSLAPRYDTTKETGVKLFIVPASVKDSRATRCGLERTAVIDIGIHAKLSKPDDPAVARLFEFTEALRRGVLSTRANGYAPVTAAVDPLFAPEALAQNHTYLSVVSITYTGAVDG